MLRHRLISAFIVVTTALAFVGIDIYNPVENCQGFGLVLLGCYLIFGSAMECTAMVRGSFVGSITAPALLGCGGVMLAALVPVYWPLFGSEYPSDCLLGELGWPLAAASFALIGSFTWYMREYETGEGYLFRAILAGWVAVYFGVGFSFAVALRLTGTPHWGLFLLVGVIVITKFADTGAYFTGRSFGRTKLCPKVSPGKTVEGLLGGIVVASLAGWVYFAWGASWAFSTKVTANPVGIAALGIGLTLSGVLGDLVESIVKRETGCKDSGRLLPGLGGLWDVTDSLIPACVVAYLIVVADLIPAPT